MCFIDSGLFLTTETAEGLSLRISDIIEYHPAKEAFIQKIGGFNVGILEELNDLHLHDFGISIKLTPDEEEKAILENNIQMALQQKSIELEDAIDLRDIRNVKLANQVLKIRRKKRQENDQQVQQQNMQMQSQMNQQAAQAAMQAEVQKNKAMSESTAGLEQIKAQLESQRILQISKL